MFVVNLFSVRFRYLVVHADRTSCRSHWTGSVDSSVLEASVHVCVPRALRADRLYKMLNALVILNPRIGFDLYKSR